MRPKPTLQRLSSTVTSVEHRLPRNKGNLQALEQRFRKETSPLETGAHPVKPAERFLTLFIRKGEIRDIDLQRLAPPSYLQYGFSQFAHPWPRQPAFEFQDHFGIRNCGDSQHAIDLACAVPKRGPCKTLEIKARSRNQRGNAEPVLVSMRTSVLIWTEEVEWRSVAQLSQDR